MAMKISLIIMVLFVAFLDLVQAKTSELTNVEEYSKFYGRITDRNQRGNILKIHTENSNIKLFQAGDITKFFMASKVSKEACIGYVRDVENNYLVLSVNNIDKCWSQFGRIRRGSMIKLESEILAKRIIDAGIFREVLIKRKNDYLKQLEEVNNFLLSFKQNKVIELARIEQEIVQLQEKKIRKANSLNLKRKDYIHLQRELNFRLDKLNEDIETYRLEKVRLLRDRWARDHDLGKPIGARPQEMKNGVGRQRRFEFDEDKW